jgi:hypothetical protein
MAFEVSGGGVKGAASHVSHEEAARYFNTAIAYVTKSEKAAAGMLRMLACVPSDHYGCPGDARPFGRTRLSGGSARPSSGSKRSVGIRGRRLVAGSRRSHHRIDASIGSSISRNNIVTVELPTDSRLAPDFWRGSRQWDRGRMRYQLPRKWLTRAALL